MKLHYDLIINHFVLNDYDYKLFLDEKKLFKRL